jgi:hypothetical protein
MLARSSLAAELPPPRYEHEGPADEPARARWWVQGAVCRDCALADGCFGLPRAYAERFGCDELSPLAPGQAP